MILIRFAATAAKNISVPISASDDDGTKETVFSKYEETGGCSQISTVTKEDSHY